MVEPLSPDCCAIQIAEIEQPASVPGGEEFKPLTSGQLLLKTRRQSEIQRRALLLDGIAADDDDEEEEDYELHEQDADSGRECLLSKVLGAGMTVLVCCFIYFAVLQSWYLGG